jgi:hypothetical protein
MSFVLLHRNIKLNTLTATKRRGAVGEGGGSDSATSTKVNKYLFNNRVLGCHAGAPSLLQNCLKSIGVCSTIHCYKKKSSLL